MNNFLFFAIPFCLLLSETTIIKSGEIQIGDTTGSSYVRTCPDYVDSCIYVCSDGFLNVCHPNQLYPIGLEPTGADINITDASHYRIYFPWEYNNLPADKFIITASWPCLSPTAVYASGNYIYWDIYGNDHCPGTLQGVIWYGDDCEDENGNIGSDYCSQLIGRFCFVAGDTLEWPIESDQSISTDVCNACWMSQPAWGDYPIQEYSDSLLFPDLCDSYDHCHHSTPDSIDCGVGFLDETDSTIVKIGKNNQIPKLFSITNYPNPFNPITNISYNIHEDIFHSITVYDIMGEFIKEIYSGYANSGLKTLQWNGTNYKGKSVSPGIYFCRIEAPGFLETNKMILLK